VDVAVKERLTGAIILIALLIIIVPEVFTDRHTAAPVNGIGAAVNPDAGPPLRTYTMELNQGATPRQAGQSALVPETPADQALPAQPPPKSVAEPLPAQVEPTKAVEPISEPPKVLPEPEQAPPRQVPPKPVAAVATGKWWAQLGSFSSRDNAERLVKQLRARGYQIEQTTVRSAGKELFRVRAGPVANREAAVALQGKLAAAGHKATLVAP
jgi:cell division septation protein DedD